jgi:hypothetical protein
LRVAICAAATAAAILLAACGSSSGTSASRSSSPATTSSAVSSPAPAYGAEQFDGPNPSAACGTNGSLNNPVVRTLGHSQVVRMPDGSPFGIVDVRHSTECQTAWGEVVRQGPKPAGWTQITIRVARHGGHNPTALPEPPINDYISPWFSAMLGNNVGDGCVVATAWVTVHGRDGPKATTTCMRG